MKVTSSAASVRANARRAFLNEGPRRAAAAEREAAKAAERAAEAEREAALAAAEAGYAPLPPEQFGEEANAAASTALLELLRQHHQPGEVRNGI
jgi:hypothetical protein